MKKGMHPNSRNGFKKGFKPTLKHRKNISKALKGIKRGKMTEEHKAKIRIANTGNVTGERHHCWKGGITPIRKRLYRTEKYKFWRESVFERDDFCCVWGGKDHGIELEADHIKPFSIILEELIKEQGMDNLFEKALNYLPLWEVNNGRTLCHDCHRQTKTWGSHKKS